MYDFDWHQKHGKKTENSAFRSLSHLKDIFEIGSVLDVGCGDGTWLNVCRTMGCIDYIGVDGRWTKIDALRIPKDRFRTFDLEDKFDLGRKFDLAISLEVAEHISPSCSDIMIENMIKHSDLIIFGAAIPYQGGFRHINEKWQSFWANKFSDHGYQCFDLIRPNIWDSDDIWFWYKQNTLVYIKEVREDLIENAKLYKNRSGLDAYPLDLVHPERYTDIASYDQIAFRPLVKKLPSRFFFRLSSILLGKA